MENNLLEISPIFMYFQDHIHKITFLFGLLTFVSLFLAIRSCIGYYNVVNKSDKPNGLQGEVINSLDLLNVTLTNLEENPSLQEKMEDYEKTTNLISELHNYVYILNTKHLYLNNLERRTIFLIFTTVVLFLITVFLPTSHTLHSIFINSNNNIVDANLLQYFMLSIDQMVNTIYH